MNIREYAESIANLGSLTARLASGHAMAETIGKLSDLVRTLTLEIDAAAARERHRLVSEYKEMFAESDQRHAAECAKLQSIIDDLRAQLLP
jgi:hypothetical protein